MRISLKQNCLRLAMLLCAAGLYGCASTAKTVEQSNVKPTNQSNTIVTTYSGSNNRNDDRPKVLRPVNGAAIQKAIQLLSNLV